MVEREGSDSTPLSESGLGPKTLPSGCAEHGYEQIKGFCKDCCCGICFRCAISKHRNHNMVNTDEVGQTDLEPMLENFDAKLTQLRDKAQLLLEKARTSETNAERLPEIQSHFDLIKEKFQTGHYKQEILGELERNYATIKTMHYKLQREEREDQTLLDTLASLELNLIDCTVFDYVRSVIDERNALIDQYERNLKNQKTMIAEFTHFDINERINEFFANIFIVKKKLTDKRIIHYFEWGNKNIHFYDVVTFK